MIKKREKSFRDHIRVNLRKVMAEGKSMDRKEAERQAKMDKREKEARYVMFNGLDNNSIYMALFVLFFPNFCLFVACKAYNPYMNKHGHC